MLQAMMDISTKMADGKIYREEIHKQIGNRKAIKKLITRTLSDAFQAYLFLIFCINVITVEIEI